MSETEVKKGWRIRRKSTGKFQRVIPTLFQPPDLKIIDADSDAEATVLDEESKAREAVAYYTKETPYVPADDFEVVAPDA